MSAESPRRVERRTVDLAGHDDLVMILLGLRVRSPRGLARAMRLRREIQASVDAEPDGLLRHDWVIWSLWPPHTGMRQYWRDFDALEAWARSGTHAGWWRAFLRDPQGTGFWHETYCIRGGIEAVYDDLPGPMGLGHFAPLRPARGSLFSARERLGRGGAARGAPPLAEEDVER